MNHQTLNNSLKELFHTEYATDVLTSLFLSGLTYADYKQGLGKDDLRFTPYHQLVKDFPNQVRFISLAQVVEVGADKVPKHITEAIVKHKVMVVFANILNTFDGLQTPYLVFRSLLTKDFMTITQPYTSLKNIPFGLSNFYGRLNGVTDFKYGMPIVLVEGLKDCLAMQSIYPFAIAMQTNRLNKGLRMVLKQITNNLVMLYDNDDAGRKGAFYDSKDLASDFKCVRLRHYVYDSRKHKVFKDIGELFEVGIFERPYVIDYYKNELIQNGGIDECLLKI